MEVFGQGQVRREVSGLVLTLDTQDIILTESSNADWGEPQKASKVADCSYRPLER